MLSKLLESIARKALKDNNKKILDEEIEKRSLKNFYTGIQLKYSIMKFLIDAKKLDWAKTYKPTNDEIAKYKLKERTLKVEINFNITNVMDIIRKKDRNFPARVAYILLITGRRISEVLINDFEFLKNELYFELSKKKEKSLFKILNLLNQDPRDVYNRLLYIREEMEEKDYLTSVSLVAKYLKKNYNITSHTLRGVYVALIHKFFNPEHAAPGYIVEKYLDSSSSSFYDHIILQGDENPFSASGGNLKKEPEAISVQEMPPDVLKLANMKMPELKKMARDMGIRRYTRMNKKEIIDAIISHP